VHVSPDTLLLAVAAAAVVARALFVAAEASLGGVSPERAAELRGAADTLGHRALHALKRDLEGTGFTTRGGAIAALALAASLGGAACVHLLAPLLGGTRVGNLAAGLAGGLGATFACLVIDLVHRSFAVAHPEAWARRIAVPTWLASRIVAPIGRFLRSAVGVALAPFGVQATFRAPAPALEDLERYLVDAGRDDAAPDSALVHSVFAFSTRIAREVMVPRTEAVAVPLEIDPRALVDVIARSGHSRLPVYDGDIDRIVGILHTRDVFPLLAQPEAIRLAELMRPPFFVPWAVRIDELLRQLQRERVPLAIVTDEHGGFMGLVTVQDLIEQIVGDLPDEFDESGPAEIEALPDGGWRVDAAVSLADFNDALDAGLPEDEGNDTLAGYLNHLAGAIPERGDTLEGHGFAFTVEERTARRVLHVRVALAGPRRLTGSLDR